ncbi:amidohydrolase family protein [Paenibacillus filicis]|uniref:Amidohydrolase family protein n=1 Tax=Paenibacillus filicis TaxID=669464 RepID=A0ABU9DCX4_9BACL
MVKETKFVLEGLHYRTGEPIFVHIENGRILDIFAAAHSNQAGSLSWLAPGLIDLQVNGCFGLDMNTLPLRPDTVLRMTRALLREGVTTYCPTVITNSPEAIEQAVGAIAGAARSYPAIAACIVGIHLEGPFISPEDGPRGAHPLEHVGPPDWSAFCRWQDAAEGRIRMVTVSPEWPGALSFISRCAESGVIVSIGHTGATAEQIREAVSAGAVMSTHLGNGTHLTLPRHPNYLWEQLAADELYGCMIADGFHLPPAVLKVILRMKGERAIVVSDSVSFSGMPPGRYHPHIGGDVVLTEEGRLHLADHPKLLAGSARLLKEQVAYLADQGLASLEDAWDCASLHPAAMLGLPQEQGLKVGAPADLVQVDRVAGRLRILNCCKAGILQEMSGEYD